MYFEKSDHPSHTGTERYVVRFQVREQDDLYDVRGDYVQYEIRPVSVLLMWERTYRDGHYTPWERRATGRAWTQSRIMGWRVLKDGTTSDKQEAYVRVFLDDHLGGRLTEYAASLPHLEQMITDLEKNLPA